jgi:hypothetical protein
LGFNNDKGLDAFAADARNLNLPTSVDWFKRGGRRSRAGKGSNNVPA